MEPGIGARRLRLLGRLGERKVRERLGLQLLEGPRLVAEGLAAGRVETVFVEDEEAAAPWRRRWAGVPVQVVGPAGLRRLCDVRTPQPVAAVGPLLQPLAPGEVLSRSARVLLLDGVQDPGNAGTLVRTATGLGMDGVLVGPGTADPASPKVLRASAGALFRTRVGAAGDRGSVEEALAASGHRLVVPVVRGGRDIREVAGPGRFVLVAGNEAAGSSLGGSREALRITIPLAAGVESLNVAAACAAILGRWL